MLNMKNTNGFHSAGFGPEIWPAVEYGRTMYTIHQRVWPLLMKMQKRYGKVEFAELTEEEVIRAERNAGFISDRVREIQMQNYSRMMMHGTKGAQRKETSRGSKALQVPAGLSALEDALKAGYDDFKTIHSDPDLANIRDTEEFEVLMEKFDESFINQNAVMVIKSLFGIFGNK